MRPEEKLYAMKPLASPFKTAAKKSLSVESAWSPLTISFSPHAVNLLK
jgi:hypothetical protein